MDGGAAVWPALTPDGRTQTHKAAGPYDMIHSGISYTSQLRCQSWRDDVYSVSPKKPTARFHCQSEIHETHLWIVTHQTCSRIKADWIKNYGTILSLQEESGRDTPSSNRASSINGTDDEKFLHVEPEEALLQTENEHLKSAIEQR